MDHLPENLGNVIVALDVIAFSLSYLFENLSAACDHELALLLLIREEQQAVLFFAIADNDYFVAFSFLGRKINAKATPTMRA